MEIAFIFRGDSVAITTVEGHSYTGEIVSIGTFANAKVSILMLTIKTNQGETVTIAGGEIEFMKGNI